jgi:hypothetical protein
MRDRSKQPIRQLSAYASFASEVSNKPGLVVGPVAAAWARNESNNGRAFSDARGRNFSADTTRFSTSAKFDRSNRSLIGIAAGISIRVATVELFVQQKNGTPRMHAQSVANAIFVI